MNRRIIPIVLILCLIMSFLAPVYPARADNPFPALDSDGDGMSDQLETAGWYTLYGGRYVTDPFSADSDRDGLSDGEEKLFNTNPLDYRDPGIGVKYNSSFKTQQYFSTSDTDYLRMVQGGDQYLMKDAMVVRRGTTFNIVGPVTGTVTLAGSGPAPNCVRGTRPLTWLAGRNPVTWAAVRFTPEGSAPAVTCAAPMVTPLGRAPAWI